MEQSESIKSLAAALCKARAAFPDIVKDREVEVTSKRTGGKYRFRYATLDNILGAIKEPLSENGFSFIQSVGNDGVALLLTHISGEWIRTDAMPIRCEENGAQAYGSAISYAKRYQICAVFGITADEDDDGNGADGNQQRQQTRIPARTNPPARQQPTEHIDTTTGEVTTNGDYADNPAFRKAVIEAFKARGFSETNLAIPAMLAMSKQGAAKKSLEDIPVDARALVVKRIRAGQFDKLKNLKAKKQAAA